MFHECATHRMSLSGVFDRDDTETCDIGRRLKR